MKVKKKHAIIGVGTAVVLALIYFVARGITGQYVVANGEYDEFARCLTDKGVVMYGSTHCGACKSQKELFGESFQLVNYVECTEQSELCAEKGIRAVPTWGIDGTLHTGLRSLESLSELSGCPLR